MRASPQPIGPPSGNVDAPQPFEVRSPAVRVGGFVLLLLGAFATALLVGSLMGPVSPDMHPGEREAPSGTGGGHDHGMAVR
ncbi:hypothetical protein [Streptomyces bohaiensis]|uniref:hypothetical protein n=1 Tax=Streptomyces bohaiensis TaxID=1431344 RepID=UPI003B7A969B